MEKSCSISRVLFSQLDAYCSLSSVLITQNLVINLAHPLTPWSPSSHRETAIDHDGEWRWLESMEGRRQWHPTPGLLPGKSHGRRSLVGCCPWGREESDMTEQLHFHFSLSCIGEGNGNPLQYSCLENPMDGGAWWAAVYGVAQSRTRLKQLSSSSIPSTIQCFISLN